MHPTIHSLIRRRARGLLPLIAALAVLALLAPAGIALAAPGDLDPTFDTDGKLTTAIGTSADNATALALQSDGKIVVAGSSRNGSNDDFALARYTSDGSLDTTFSSDGKLTTAIGSSDDNATGVAVQSDGKIVVAGSSRNGSNDDFALVRYTSTGSLDTTFSGDGKLTTAIGSSDDQALALALQSDGKIVVAGFSRSGFLNLNYDFALARYTSTGSLDTTFSSDGILTTAIGASIDIATALALQSDGDRRGWLHPHRHQPRLRAGALHQHGQSGHDLLQRRQTDHRHRHQH
jgi:uncharacterized delta-60 repeat protein